MKSKMLGGILLIVGTTIGAGMLALPVVTAQAGFWGALFLLIASWAVMTFSAFFILEASLWMPMDSNIILMVKKTLGPLAEMVAWVCYLLLFYCLLAAYVAGGSDILRGLISALGVNTSSVVDAILFVIVLASIVYQGIKSIDYANRALMLIKLSAFVLLVLLVIPHIDVVRYNDGKIQYLFSAVTVVITSFGFATLVPSLRGYFNNDVQKLRKVILIGSLIPLTCYILWVGAVFGSVPYSGQYGLVSIIKSDHSTLALTQSLIYYLHNSWVTSFTRIFTAVCVFTSFLGVSLCVVDFLADGFQLEKKGVSNLILHAATFVPPLVIALIFPNAFIIGLNYAGIIIAILMLILPAMMVWSGRYRKKIVADYRVMGGKFPLIMLMVVAVVVIVQGLIYH